MRKASEERGRERENVAEENDNKPIKSGPRTEEEGIEKAIKWFEREKKN
jgi:hypothetical protein